MILDLHNLMRWLVLLSGFVALVDASAGWLKNRPFNKRTGWLYMTALHTQLLIAIALYATSPLVRAAWHDMAAAMHQRDLRFFSIEHPFQMLIAMTVATLGYGRAKRRRSWKIAALSTAISLLLILTVIPWPFSSHPRRLGPGWPKVHHGTLELVPASGASQRANALSELMEVPPDL